MKPLNELTGIYLNGECYDTIVFSRDSDKVKIFDLFKYANNIAVPADKVLLMFGWEKIYAGDFIRSLTEDDLSEIRRFSENIFTESIRSAEDDVDTYLISIYWETDISSKGLLTGIRLDERGFTVNLSKETHTVFLYSFDDSVEDIAIPADHVFLKTGQEEINAGDYLNSLTDKDIEQLPYAMSLSEGVYLILESKKHR